jgi:hypothetical protein
LSLQLGHFGAAAVGVKSQLPGYGIHLPQHHGACIGQAVCIDGSEHRRAPFVVPVQTGPAQLFPNLRANFFGRLQVDFHDGGAGVRWGALGRGFDRMI